MSTASPSTSRSADASRRWRSTSTSASVGRYHATTDIPWWCAASISDSSRSCSSTTWSGTPRCEVWMYTVWMPASAMAAMSSSSTGGLSPPRAWDQSKASTHAAQALVGLDRPRLRPPARPDRSHDPASTPPRPRAAPGRAPTASTDAAPRPQTGAGHGDVGLGVARGDRGRFGRGHPTTLAQFGPVAVSRPDGRAPGRTPHGPLTDADRERPRPGGAEVTTRQGGRRSFTQGGGPDTPSSLMELRVLAWSERPTTWSFGSYGPRDRGVSQDLLRCAWRGAEERSPRWVTRQSTRRVICNAHRGAPAERVPTPEPEL